MTRKTWEFLEFVAHYRDLFTEGPSRFELIKVLGRDHSNIDGTLQVLQDDGYLTWDFKDYKSIDITKKGRFIFDLLPVPTVCNWKNLEAIWDGRQPEKLTPRDKIRVDFLAGLSDAQKAKYGLSERR